MEFTLQQHLDHVVLGKPAMFPIGTAFTWNGEDKPYEVLIEQVGNDLKATVSEPNGGPVLGVFDRRGAALSCVTPYWVKVLVRMALAFSQ